nr:hypothetical protein [Anaerolineae bacterium]
MKMGRSLPLLAIALVAGLLMVLFVLLRLFAAPTPAESLEALTATPDWQNVVLVTVLVGISVVLFVYQLGWGALRVTATVALALALGYLVTIFFNLDTANRYISGEFRVAL